MMQQSTPKYQPTVCKKMTPQSHCDAPYKSQDLVTLVPMIDEWIKDTWHGDTMEYDSMMSSDEILLFPQHGWHGRESC